MTLYGSLIVYSTEAFSEHYSQTRASLRPYILMATFTMKVYWNIENIDVILLCRFLFTVNRDEDNARESFDSKSFNVLRDIIINQLRCYDFYLMWSSWGLCFPLNTISQ